MRESIKKDIFTFFERVNKVSSTYKKSKNDLILLTAAFKRFDELLKTCNMMNKMTKEENKALCVLIQEVKKMCLGFAFSVRFNGKTVNVFSRRALLYVLKKERFSYEPENKKVFDEIIDELIKDINSLPSFIEDDQRERERVLER